MRTKDKFYGSILGATFIREGNYIREEKQFYFQSVKVTFLHFSSVKLVLSFFYIAQDVKYVQS